MKRWLLKWLLRTPSQEMRAIILSTALENIGALPARGIIDVRVDGVININGKPIDYESVRALRESARAIKDSFAWGLVREQVAFKAVSVGVHNGNTPEQIVFSKAALWWMQQLEEIIESLANE